MYSYTLSLTSALNWGRVVNARLRPIYPLYPLYRGLGGPQGRSRQMRKISPPTGIRSPDRPARTDCAIPTLLTLLITRRNFPRVPRFEWIRNLNFRKIRIRDIWYETHKMQITSPRLMEGVRLLLSESLHKSVQFVIHILACRGGGGGGKWSDDVDFQDSLTVAGSAVYWNSSASFYFPSISSPSTEYYRRRREEKMRRKPTPFAFFFCCFS